MSKLRPATKSQVRLVWRAIALLQEARDKLAEADCPRSAAKVRRALKSAEGAGRHITRRVMAAEKIAPRSGGTPDTA